MHVCGSDLGPTQGGAGHCSEYIAEMTSDMESKKLGTKDLPLLFKSD